MAIIVDFQPDILHWNQTSWYFMLTTKEPDCSILKTFFQEIKVFKKWALSSDQFMLNGRKVRSVTTFPEIEKKSSLILIKQKDGKARIILPKSKR